MPCVATSPRFFFLVFKGASDVDVQSRLLWSQPDSVLCTLDTVETTLKFSPEVGVSNLLAWCPQWSFGTLGLTVVNFFLTLQVEPQNPGETIEFGWG